MITKIKVEKVGTFFLDPCKWCCSFYCGNRFYVAHRMTKRAAIRAATQELQRDIESKIIKAIEGKIEYRIEEIF